MCKDQSLRYTFNYRCGRASVVTGERIGKGGDMAEKKTNEGSNGSAMAEPKKKARKAPAPKRNTPKLLPPWKVLLHNDDVNVMEYVVQTITVLTPLNEDEAHVRTIDAHKTGVSLLLTTHRERAELYEEQFQSKGLTVTIEPAEA